MVTSIIISDKPIDEIKIEQKTIPKIRNNFFALFHVALPYNDDVFNKMKEGNYKIPTEFGINNIHFGKINIFESKVVSSNEWIKGAYTLMLRATNFGVEEERKELWLTIDEQVVEEQRILLTNLDFNTSSNLIKHHLKINYTKGDRKDLEIEVLPPATIKKLSFQKNDLEVILEKKSKIDGLQLNLDVKRDNRTVWKDYLEIPLEKIEFENNPEVFRIPVLLPLDFLQLKLIHKDSGLILDTTNIKAPIENAAEPFVVVLDTFCSLDKLKRMLFEPENIGKNPDKIFDKAVTWLLSLAGYDTIHIGTHITKLNGKKETFDKIDKKSGYNFGCADIIAYEENERILLIACDIGSLDPKKIQDLCKTKKYFRTKLKGYEKLPIVPILFTPRDIRASSPSVDVFIANKDVITRIFEALVKGNRDRARSFLYYSGI